MIVSGNPLPFLDGFKNSFNYEMVRIGLQFQDSNNVKIIMYTPFRLTRQYDLGSLTPSLNLQDQSLPHQSIQPFHSSMSSFAHDSRSTYGYQITQSTMTSGASQHISEQKEEEDSERESDEEEETEIPTVDFWFVEASRVVRHDKDRVVQDLLRDVKRSLRSIVDFDLPKRK